MYRLGKWAYLFKFTFHPEEYFMENSSQLVKGGTMKGLLNETL